MSTHGENRSGPGSRKQILFSAGLVAVVALGVAGYSLAGGEKEQAGGGMEGHDHAAMAGAGGAEAGPVRLDAEAARRIGVTYATATVKPFGRSVSTVGSVTYDETRLANVNPKIEGWVEKLYVDFTGAPVRAGAPLMEVYSPMLVSAQEELILARRLVEEAEKGGSERAVHNAQAMLEAARRRLRYWDIPADQIARVEESGTTSRTLTLRAPASGIVLEKSVVEGTRIMPGMDLFKVADLSRVWVEGDVFEKDLSLVRLGQTARVSFDAYPGEVFAGRITYVYPTVDVESRTGRVRVEIENPGLRLKPGMYAKLEMDTGDGRQALVVPRSAVHWTGKRALVFVRHDDGMLMPHEVTTGLVAGGEIEILGGITEGMQVVSSANFLIDAESNMGGAMSSMPGMDMGDGASQAPSGHGAAPAAGGHEGHTPGMDMSKQAPTDPHSGHAMPAPAKPAADPHAGHQMPAPAAPAAQPAAGHTGH